MTATTQVRRINGKDTADTPAPRVGATKPDPGLSLWPFPTAVAPDSHNTAPKPKIEKERAKPLRMEGDVAIFRGIDHKSRSGRDNQYPWDKIEVGEQFFLRSASSSGASYQSKRLAPKRFSSKSGVMNPVTGKLATLVTRVE